MSRGVTMTNGKTEGDEPRPLPGRARPPLPGMPSRVRLSCQQPHRSGRRGLRRLESADRSAHGDSSRPTRRPAVEQMANDA